MPAEAMRQRVADEVGDDLFERTGVAVHFQVGGDFQLDAVPAVFETGTQGDEHLLDGLPQVEHAPAGAALIDRHLLEVADQFGGAGGIAFEQIDRFATAAEQAVHLRTAQAAAGNGLRRTRETARRGRWRRRARCRAACSVRAPRRRPGCPARRAFPPAQLRHRLPQLVGALGDQFLEVFAIRRSSSSTRRRSVMSEPTLKTSTTSPCSLLIARLVHETQTRSPPRRMFSLILRSKLSGLRQISCISGRRSLPPLSYGGTMVPITCWPSSSSSE
jgi:hypothetical protein